MTPQPEGRYTVTSPVLPELITAGDSIRDAMEYVTDALAAVVELYEELGRPLPQSTQLSVTGDPVWFETVISTA